MAKHVVARGLEVYRQHGAAALGWTLVSAAGRRLAGLVFDEVVWLNVERISPALKPDAAFEFRFLTPEELERYAADPIHDLDSTLAERVRAGLDHCFAALDGGRLAAYGWYALDSIEPEHASGVGFRYGTDAAFMYKGYTHPDYRGRRLHGIGMGLALRALDRYGVRRLVSLVEKINFASLKSCQRLGYECLGTMVTQGPRARLLSFPRAARARGVVPGQWTPRRVPAGALAAAF